MDKSAIVEQMEIFAVNLVSILEALESLQNEQDQASNETKISLNDSKLQLFDTILMLNTALTDSGYSTNSQDIKLFPGSLVLAPRFYEGNMCLDFAIVTKISKPYQEDDAYQSSELMLRNQIALTTYSGQVYNDIVDSVYTVIWLRPQSQYEVMAREITFTGAQLTHKALSLYHQQTEELQCIKEGSTVLYLCQLTKQLGVWKKGKILEIMRNTEMIQIQDCSVNGGGGSMVCPFMISYIAPLPDSGHHTTREQYNPYTSTGQTLYSDDDEDNNVNSDNEQHEGVKTIKSYASVNNSSNNSYGSSDNLNLYKNTSNSNKSLQAVGQWEQHTKGVGSKLMAKMGYKQGSGFGLGKYSQGIAVPIEGLAKPLPQGLSLDFIHEQKNAAATSSSSSGKKDANQITLDIVRKFNEKHMLSSKKSKSSHNTSNTHNKLQHQLQQAQHLPQERDGSERSMFTFLNNMDFNKNNTAATSIKKSNTSQQAVNIKPKFNTNINKLF